MIEVITQPSHLAGAQVEHVVNREIGPMLVIDRPNRDNREASAAAWAAESTPPARARLTVARAEIARLQAEVERLRAGLRALLNDGAGHG